MRSFEMVQGTNKFEVLVEVGRLLVRFVKSEDKWATIGRGLRVIVRFVKGVQGGMLYSAAFWWVIGGILVFVIGVTIGQHHEND